MPATQQARLALLRRLEAETPDEALPPHEQLRFEIEHCGAPISTYQALRDEYAVLEVDDRYSPKLRLCNVANGRIGAMKIKKALFQARPLAVGDFLRLRAWDRRPFYRYVDGKAKPNPDRQDLWITEYEVLT